MESIKIHGYNFHIFKIIEEPYKALHVTSDYNKTAKDFEKEFNLFIESINLLKLLFYDRFDKKYSTVNYKSVKGSYLNEKQLLIIVKWYTKQEKNKETP